MVLILIPQRMLMLLTLCAAIVRVHILHTAVHIHAYYFDSCCPYIYLCKVVVPWISSSYSADNCRHQGHAGSKTLHQQNPPVLHWRCWLTQVDLYNGRKTVVVVFVDNWSRLFTRGISGRFLLTKTVSAMH